MRLSVLASSSRGNASVIAAGETVLMVDAGITARRMQLGIEACGLHPSAVQGIMITHEHADHTAGLPVFTRKYTTPVYCSRYLRDDMRELTAAPLTFLEPGCTVQIGELSITPFGVCHDAVDPLGYLFEHGGVRLGYLTDTGHTTRAIESLLEGVDALYVESNYDEDMLHNSGRSRDLIRRIEGNWGHLSNTQAGELVARLAHPGLRHVILGHISPECNTPRLATRCMQSVLSEVSPHTRLHTALQAERLDWIEI